MAVDRRIRYDLVRNRYEVVCVRSVDAIYNSTRRSDSLGGMEFFCVALFYLYSPAWGTRTISPWKRGTRSFSIRSTFSSGFYGTKCRCRRSGKKIHSSRGHLPTEEWKIVVHHVVSDCTISFAPRGEILRANVDQSRYSWARYWCGPRDTS